MRNKAHLLFLFLPALASLRCQYPLDDFSSPDRREFIQFEAEITPLYAFVKVTNTSTRLAGSPRVEQPAAVAALYITDNRGARYDLPLNGDSLRGFRGIVGQTYVLHALVAGKNYESTPELLRPAPEIDSIDAPFSTRGALAEKDLFKHGFDIRVHYRDFSEKGDYYQWVWTNYSKKFRCGEFVRPGGNNSNIPCASDCWEINYSRDITIFSDANSKTPDLIQPLARVPFLIPPTKYYLMVEQRSIGKNAYDYFYSAREQTQSNGGQFDVPAQTRFSTNIVCKDDPAEKVLGVFNVFDLRRRIYYVNRGVNIPGVTVKIDGQALLPPCPLPFCAAPCPVSRFVTDKQPEGWVE